MADKGFDIQEMITKRGNPLNTHTHLESQQKRDASQL